MGTSYNQLIAEMVDQITQNDARLGNHTPIKASVELQHDIQVVLARLVAKAGQLIGNETTNLAECWMHIRCKFDGGKVINRSQSGSWEHRCMGLGSSKIWASSGVCKFGKTLRNHPLTKCLLKLQNVQPKN